MALSARQRAAIKVVVFVVCLIPLARLAWGAWNDTLGANPIEFIIRALGDWGLRFVLITLAVTPLRKLSGWNWLIALRRMLGLYAFFYAALHLSAYLWVDQFFDWIAIAKDIIKRPFITVGMLTFAILVPLAITSNNAMIRRMGAQRWQTLHRAVYAIGILGVLHFWWMVKLNITQPVIYAAVLTFLLATRLFGKLRRAHLVTAPRERQ
jgi:methionine sulfoxide reductase heme-binding subunit